ncbi:hypothetical protein ACFRI7_07020 [Streptomyces sp. NPDC056716]|uniref:hypothetical protein n=1 Tax=unclassified Streptomyces TaxID=2593676 RepID=UPI0036D1FCB2
MDLANVDASMRRQAEFSEIGRVERWTTREAERPDNQGLTVFLYNTARLFISKF